jgi:predicted enzyme related to lactoylglutathione lyase
MADPKYLPGKFVWFEHVSKDAKKAQAFYAEVLGWKVEAFPMGGATYEMINAGGTSVGGYALRNTEGRPSHWIAYVSVENVDATAKAATANGGKIIDAPLDMPTIGRMARIADPQGGEICLFKSANGDQPDVTEAPPGRFFWNELHTGDAAKALQFYEKVLGFSRKAMEMSPTYTYYILSKGGVDRGGVSGHLPPGSAAQWLPYVSVADVDKTAARATKLGGTIVTGPDDIPNVGRFAVLKDPTGATIAVMKPNPTEKR